MNRQMITLGFLFSVLSLSVMPIASGQLADTGWPKPGKDLGNTCLADDVPVAAPFAEWELVTGHEAVFPGVAIDTLGNIVFKGSWYNPSSVTSANSGGIVWEKTERGSSDWGSPAVSESGRVYVQNAVWSGYGNNEVACYDVADGTEYWAIPNGASDSSATIASNGRIYFVGGSKLTAVTDNGSSFSVNWSITLPGDAGVGSPAVTEDGQNRIFVTVGNGVAAVEDQGSSATILWQATGLPSVTCHPVAGPSGGVYLTHASGSDVNLTRFNADTGALVWSALMLNPDDSTANFWYSGALSADGQTFYAVAAGDRIFAVNTSDGSMKWSWAPDSPNGESWRPGLTVLPSGYIYMPSIGGRLYCVKDDGPSASLFWSFYAGAGRMMRSSVAVGPDGTVYATSWINGDDTSGILYALMPWDGGVLITTNELPDAVIDEAYSGQLGAWGGVEPYTWSIESGTLPPGLSLNSSTGEITGTPTMDGDYDFTVEVVDSTGGTPQSETKQLSISVLFLPVEIQPGLAVAEVNKPYSANIVAQRGDGSYTFTLVAGTLPAGLSFNTSTGEISGTPTAVGDTTIVVKATDGQPTEATRDITIQVLDPDLWQFFQRTKRHIGTGLVAAPTSPDILWETPGQAGGYAPVFNKYESESLLFWVLGWATGGNGPSYNLRAVNGSDGSTAWYTPWGTAGHNNCTAAIGVKGDSADTIYLAASKIFAAVNVADGSLKWSFLYETYVYGNQNPTVDSTNDEIYVKEGNPIYAFSDEGTYGSIAWTSEETARDNASPAFYDLYDEGEIFLQVSTTNSEALRAYKVSDKTILWTYASTGAIYAAPVIDSTNNIYVIEARGQNTVVCINGEDGSEIWERALDDGKIARGNGALSMDQKTFYVTSTAELASDPGVLYAINTANGTVKWVLPTTSWRTTTTAFNCMADGAGKVYFTAGGHAAVPNTTSDPPPTMYCVKDNGTSGSVMWTLGLDDSPYRHAGGKSFSLSADGVLYAPLGLFDWDTGSYRERLFAFYAAASPEPPVITDMERGSMTITFTGGGQTYKVQSSTDPYDFDETTMTWTDEATGLAPGTWQDTAAPTGTGAEKYYRVVGETDASVSETVGLYAVSILNGRNMMSIPFLPFPEGGGAAGTSTFDKIIGDQLTGHAVVKTLSDLIQQWNADTLTWTKIWLKVGTGWIDYDTGGAAMPFVPGRGYWVFRNGHPDTDVVLFGQVAKTDQVITVLASRNILGTPYPVDVALDDSGLVASGFNGHAVVKTLSDQILFWDAATLSWKQFWYKVGVGFQPWTTGDPMKPFAPGDGFYLLRQGSTGFTWTYPVPN